MTNPSEMARLLAQCQRRVAEFNEAMERLETDLAEMSSRSMSMAATLRWHAEIEAEVADIKACLIDGTLPARTAAVDARLARHAQERR